MKLQSNNNCASINLNTISPHRRIKRTLLIKLYRELKRVHSTHKQYGLRVKEKLKRCHYSEGMCVAARKLLHDTLAKNPL